MIHHIVIWKLKDFAEGKSKKENAKLIKEGLENLKNYIPEIIEIRVGINIESNFSNADIVLHSYFKNMEDIFTYQNHPKHHEIANFIGKVREERYCVDYEF